jgi:hypothetical protein
MGNEDWILDTLMEKATWETCPWIRVVHLNHGLEANGLILMDLNLPTRQNSPKSHNRPWTSDDGASN